MSSRPPFRAFAPAWRRLPAEIGARRVDRELLSGSPFEIAPKLLNLLLVHQGVVGRIVEVEAYGADDDRASHAFRGQTARNDSMFGLPGLLYVYFTYGMHYCANVVCHEEGSAGAVLVRALEPVGSIEKMRERRPKGERDELLCAGPAKLCQALAITKAQDGSDLITSGEILLLEDGTPPPEEPRISPRIGLSERAADARALQCNFSVPGHAAVSRTRLRSV